LLGFYSNYNKLTFKGFYSIKFFGEEVFSKIEVEQSKQREQTVIFSNVLFQSRYPGD